jgi:hypothetical protein
MKLKRNNFFLKRLRIKIKNKKNNDVSGNIYKSKNNSEFLHDYHEFWEDKR